MTWARVTALPGAAMLWRWFQRRDEAARFANVDAAGLIRDHGDQAYWEARRRERDVILSDGTTHLGRTPVHWRRVALIVAKKTDHSVGLDTATRMLSPSGEATPVQREKLDAEDVKRLTGL